MDYLIYKRPIKNRYKISHLLGSIISNFLLEYVVFLVKYMIFALTSSRLSLGQADEASRQQHECLEQEEPIGNQ